MKTEPKYLKKKPHRAHERKSIVPILGGVLLALLVLDVLIFGGGMLIKSSRREKQLERPTESYTQSAGTPASQPEAAMQASTAPEGEPQTSAGTQAEQEPDVMRFLPYLEEKRQAHPEILLDLKDEQRTYEVIAALRDRVYYVTEDCFKFYKFIDAESDEAYEEVISYFKSHTNYDTGLSAKRRDKLITLVTCASHVDNGRFVVVAREKRS